LQEKALNMTYVKQALGPRGDVIIARTSEDIRQKQKILAKIRQDEGRYIQQREAKEKELDLKRRIELEVSKKACLKTIQPQIRQKLKEKNKC